MTFDPVYVVLIVAAIFVAVVTLVRMQYRRRLEPLTTVLDERSGEVQGWFSFTLAGHFNGREAAFVATPGGKNRPPKFQIRLGCRAPIEFLVRKEGLGSRIAKSLRLMKDVDTGDFTLDSKYVFSSREPEIFSRWVREPQVREAITKLMDQSGVDRLALDGGHLETLRVRPGDTMEPQHVRGVLENLETLARTFEVGR
jgi:hypothetical protein